MYFEHLRRVDVLEEEGKDGESEEEEWKEFVGSVSRAGHCAAFFGKLDKATSVSFSKRSLTKHSFRFN